MIKRLVLASLITLSVLLAAVPTGCGTETIPTPSAPPPIVKTTATTPAAASSTSPTATGSPAITATESPAPSSMTAILETIFFSSVNSRLALTSNQAKISFPDKITFSISGESTHTLKTAVLRYGTNERSLAPLTNTAKVQFQEGKQIDASWSWEMKKTGSIPPGVTVWWQWEFSNFEGNNASTRQQTIKYADTRFEWKKVTQTKIDLYYHDQSQSMIDQLLAGVDASLERIKLDVAIPPDRKPQVFVYRSSEELQEAVLFEQQWTGAIAYPGFNIILTAADAAIMEWAKTTLPHEITHLLVGEYVYGPFSQLPVWLNEGLAEYSEGAIASNYKQILQQAARNNTLISVQSLGSEFPTDPNQAYLAYGQSNSLVRLLIEQYDWPKMRELLTVFKDGSTEEAALKKVYGLSMSELEAKLKNYILSI